MQLCVINPQDRKNGRLQDHKDGRPQDHKDGRPQEHKDGRRQDHKDGCPQHPDVARRQWPAHYLDAMGQKYHALILITYHTIIIHP